MRLQRAIEDLPNDLSESAILDELTDAMALLISKRTVVSYAVAIKDGIARVTFKLNPQQEEVNEVEESIPRLTSAAE
jgi:hypothetical protein